MPNTLNHYTVLADLFFYPDTAYAARVGRVQALLDEQYPQAGIMLKPFSDFAAQASLTMLEELFTRSFDVQAITTLDLGYVLFGDDYKRGALLVNMNREHREVGNDCFNELADHLPNVLRLLPKLQDAALREEMIEKIVAPALRKIISEFDPKKMGGKKNVYLKHHKTWIEQSEDYGTIFQRPLAALYMVLEEDFHVQETVLPGPSSDFLKSIGTEIVLETQ